MVYSARVLFYSRIRKKALYTMPKVKGQKNKKPYGVGPPAQRGGYQYRARPAHLTSRPRSDGSGTRHPITVRINESCDLEILNANGRRIDGRTAVVKAGKAILAALVEELGGLEAITFKQRLQLEVVVRRTLIGRSLFESTVRGDERVNPHVGVDNDRVLLTALDRTYSG